MSAGRDPLTGQVSAGDTAIRGNPPGSEDRAGEARDQTQRRTVRRHYGNGRELVPLWLIELERKQRSPRTVHEYGRRYRHDIEPALGQVAVSKVTTKMLTDLYGAHQQRGASPGSVRKIHATVSSMMSQACRWGWRNNNPAEWA